MNIEAIKFLASDNRGPFSGAPWPLPDAGKPGEWLEAKGELCACWNGIHACTIEQALTWLNARAYLIELDGEIISKQDKLCARRGRLLRQLDWNPAVFAADCLEHVLYLYERKHPGDSRVRDAIEAACSGKATSGDAWGAGAAAWGASRAASMAAWGASRATSRTADADAAEAARAIRAARAARAIAVASWPGRESSDASVRAVGELGVKRAVRAEREWQVNTLAQHLGVTHLLTREAS